MKEYVGFAWPQKKTCRHAVKCREDDFTLRDSANYKYHLEAVNENPDYGTVYGVLRECCFSSLNYAPSLFPPDVMHDILEF